MHVCGRRAHAFTSPTLTTRVSGCGCAAARIHRQHIVPRYSEDELAPAVNKLIARIKELEEEVARLKGDKS